jgi:hypothetical protein
LLQHYKAKRHLRLQHELSKKSKFKFFINVIKFSIFFFSKGLSQQEIEEENVEQRESKRKRDEENFEQREAKRKRDEEIVEQKEAKRKRDEELQRVIEINKKIEAKATPQQKQILERMRQARMERVESLKKTKQFCEKEIEKLERWM